MILMTMDFVVASVVAPESLQCSNTGEDRLEKEWCEKCQGPKVADTVVREEISWGSRLDGERIEAKTRLIGGKKIEEHTIRSFHDVKE